MLLNIHVLQELCLVNVFPEPVLAEEPRQRKSFELLPHAILFVMLLLTEIENVIPVPEFVTELSIILLLFEFVKRIPIVGFINIFLSIEELDIYEKAIPTLKPSILILFIVISCNLNAEMPMAPVLLFVPMIE